MSEVRWTVTPFRFIMQKLDDREHLTWLNILALWLVRNDGRTHHEEVMKTFDLTYSHVDNLLRQLLHRGLCHREKQRNSRRVDYITNDAFHGYAKYLYTKKIEPYVDMSWDEYLNIRDIGHPLKPSDSCRERTIQTEPDLILRMSTR